MTDRDGSEPTLLQPSQDAHERRSCPAGWQSIPISELGQVVTGTTPPTSDPSYFGGPYMFITPGDIGDSRFVNSTGRHLTEKGLHVSRELPMGTVVVSCIGIIGKVAITASERSATNQQINAVIPNEQVLPDFLYYNLLFHSREITTLASRTVVPIVKKSVFADFCLPLPEFKEQRAIATALNAVQKAKEARQRELALERERKAALMEYLFTHGTRGEPTAETRVGRIPASWNVVVLSEVCVVKTSFPSFASFASLDSGQATDELILGLKVSDMNLPGNERSIQDSQNRFRVPVSKMPRQLLRPNSVVFPKRGAAIATNKKRLTTTYSLLDPNLIGVEPTDNMDSRFLFAFFERFDLKSLQDNTPIPQLNKHNVDSMLIPLPSAKEQQTIGDLVEAMDTGIAALEREYALLDELFRAMLEELMTGRLSAVPLIEEHQAK